MNDDVRSKETHWLLAELCVRHGFCLPPEEQQRLVQQAPFMSVDTFTDAVFIAEVMDPSLYRDLRRSVRETVRRRLPEIEDRQSDT
ncbi:hypothetical protein [Nonomuraea gerenzanensis]|uniref:hypothetical protein n=1 Tax=Nonomuraea gerenzanensis TaxID=93944 RepID=UPI001CD9696F|nr:hypothetical protein [Nonomuraea gerenzanensis]UBU12698.1 hypothetical protein LCN96_51985 [Nonomuraea gerenzanensis]